MTGRTPRKLVIIGHGYVAGFLTPLMRNAGWEVIGTTRTDPARVTAAGAKPLIWDGVHHAGLQNALRDADAVLSSVAPVGGADPVLPALSGIRPGWTGYLSSTGVYGDADGAWLDEDAPTNATSPHARARIRAEQDWQGWAARSGIGLHVFRLSGIYGPGRSALDRLRQGRARRIIKPGQVFSRIHAEDIARAIKAAMDSPRVKAGTWNLADGTPAPPEDVIEAAAEMAGLPVPPAEDFASADLSPMTRSFYANNRRIDARRIRDALGWAPLYPDYRAGLAAILQTETAASAGNEWPAPEQTG